MRAPTHATLDVQHLRWADPDPDIIEFFTPVIERFPGSLQYSGREELGALRHMRLVSNTDNMPRYHIKIQADDQRARQALLIAGTLGDAGIKVPVFVDSIPLSDGSVAWIFQWLNGTYPVSRDFDYLALGSTVARVQNALVHSPLAQQVRKNTDARLDALLDWGRSGTFENKVSAPISNNMLRHYRDCFVKNNAQITSNCWLTHGDLNPGNILMMKGKGIAILDFEDTLHSCLWPGFDLAKLVERLVLPKIENYGQDWAKQTISGITNGYLDALDEDLKEAFAQGPGLAVAMRWHIGLSLLILTRDYELDSAIVNCEIAKFAKLGLLVDDNEELL